jgi:hypothetical protein
MRRWAGLLVVACLMLAACQRSNRTENDRGGASIDGIQFQGVFHAQWTMVTSHPKGVRPLGPTDLGRVVGRVVANRTEEPVESAIPFRNLEAMFLPVGTPVYAVRGYPTSFRLAARSNGRLAIYEPWYFPAARVGADLLGGIQGSVRRIGIYSTGKPMRPLGTIGNPQQVEHLVRLVLQAPAVEQDPASGPHDDEPYVLSFHLKDGTATSRLFNAKTGYLAGGVVVPDQFITAVGKAIGHHRQSAPVCNGSGIDPGPCPPTSGLRA